MQPARRPRAADDVAGVDRRWFLAALLTFLGSLGGLFGAVAIYRATGPHPETTGFLRRLKVHASRLLRQRLRRGSP